MGLDLTVFVSGVMEGEPLMIVGGLPLKELYNFYSIAIFGAM